MSRKKEVEVTELGEKQPPVHIQYTPTRELPRVITKKVTINTDAVGTFGPLTTAQHQSEMPLAVIKASTSHYSGNFDLALFCDTGAGIDICSLTTVVI